MEKKYYKHKIENLLVVNRIVAIHYFEFETSFQSKVEAHDFWECVCVLEGNIVCQAGEKAFALSEGEMLFHAPNEPHSFRADGKNKPKVFFVCFACKSEAADFFQGRILSPDKSLLRLIYPIIEEGKKTFDLPDFDPEMKKMNLLPNPTLGGQQLVKNYLEILLITLMRGETEKENADVFFLPHDKFREQVSKRVILLLRERIDEKLTVADICEALHYNKSYIFEQFKKATGQSVMTYFIRLKTEKAKRLLRETDTSITQIAETLSFDTPNYFSKTFKKITGYTPLQYRKTHAR